ncbi:MAG: hypothetical protein COT06_02520 [Syntrophobacteraceae bacterium CG07_land_8_20_14_0_80_61_8]|nr:MAG: hypothetical protein COT06_02520 [Syntrophobacteraceae bacterium CG07_land_8_20_14_0_80_61_8]
MEILEAVRTALEDAILPESAEIKQESAEIKADLAADGHAARAEVVIRRDQTNDRLARLHEVIGRREEHTNLVQRLTVLERERSELKRKMPD